MREIRAAHILTLKNPWAHLIAHSGKDVENRTWMPHEGVDTLLIHAGKAWDPFAPFADRGACFTSGIVAVADLAYACNTSRFSDELKCGCGEWAEPGQCHWKLTNVRPITPVPCAGRQGLWLPTPAMLADVNASLAVSA